MNQNELRGDGKLPVISIDAKTIAEGTYKAIVGCYDQGARIETPKQREDMSLGYDADMIVRIENPLEGPHACYPGIHDDARGIVQYMLEVTHGIHNHWKKSEEHPNRWGYTYNERFVDQLPFVFQRIKSKGKLKYDNAHYGFPIMTAQEKELLLNEPLNITIIEENLSIVDYSTIPQQEFCKDWSKIFQEEKKNFIIENLKEQVSGKKFK